MILIGQFDSPFVRRVGVALRLYDIPFEHRPWSTFGDAQALQMVNPLMRVPALVLDDGDVLIDSHLILDYIDSLVPVEKRMYPAAEPERHRAIKVSALATGLSDKAVGLFYEKVLHKQAPSETWIARCISQIKATMAQLEDDRAKRGSLYWFGDRIGHCDIAVTCSIRHLGDVHPELADARTYPALAEHAIRMEALPVFEEISQVFMPPA